MSTDLLRLIPVEPSFVPSADGVAAARSLIRQYFPIASLVTSETSEEVRFIDQGENFEKVLCPSCSKELETEWWQSAMDVAFGQRFNDLSVQVPCCRQTTSLNALDYHWPAGFARFSIEIEDPNNIDISDEDLGQIERLLGTKLRRIRARY